MTTVEKDEVTSVDVDALVAAEIKTLREEGKLDLIPEPRCWICNDDPTRKLVNNLLARGMSFGDVSDIVEEAVNPVRRARGDRPITIRRIRTHSRKHFDFEHPSWQIYRRIAEKRAREAGQDFENGIGNTVHHLALLDTVIQKSYENLMNPYTVVGVRDGITAAKERAEIERKSVGQLENEKMLAQINQIILAVKSTVPMDMWDTILNRLANEAAVIPAGAGQVALPVTSRRVNNKQTDEDDDEFDPGDDEDFDNEDE